MLLIFIPIVVALLVSASAVQADFTTESCLAAKLAAAGNFRKCRDGQQAKLLQSKPADVAKCSTKFQEKIAKISDKASKAGIACRYRDNGDRTVTDYDTQLQWEKKEATGTGDGVHTASNSYPWGISPNEADGDAFTFVLSHLNNCSFAPGIVLNLAGFAFHCDWRMPSLDELQTILLAPSPCGTSPCIDPIFGPTASDFLYWTFTTNTDNSGQAWGVSFNTGSLATAAKSSFNHVRAVRGGL